MSAREEYHGREQVHTANGLGMNISHIGRTILSTQSSKPLLLGNILCVPTIMKNFVSVWKLTKENCMATCGASIIDTSHPIRIRVSS